MNYDLGTVTVRKRNRLPHWDPEAGIQFTTFNLADAIPEASRQRIRLEAESQIQSIERSRGSVTSADRAAIAAWKRRQLHEVLDESHGTCLLRDPENAKIVENAIRFLDGLKYALISWTVMPSHVHVVFSLRDHPTDAIMHSLKSYTANEINKRVGRAGPLWQRDYFDRTLRTSDELQRVVNYVLRNASTAGIEPWPFAGLIRENLAAAL